MPPFHKNSHEFRDVNGKLVLVKVYPTMQIAVKDGRLVAQGGELWYPNGDKISPWPAWAVRELAKCSDEALTRHGFDPAVVRKVKADSKPMKPRGRPRKTKPATEINTEVA